MGSVPWQGSMAPRFESAGRHSVAVLQFGFRLRCMAEGNSSSRGRDANWGRAGGFAEGCTFRLISQRRFAAGADLLCNGPLATTHVGCRDWCVLWRYFFVFAAGAGSERGGASAQHRLATARQEWG